MLRLGSSRSEVNPEQPPGRNFGDEPGGPPFGHRHDLAHDLLLRSRHRRTVWLRSGAWLLFSSSAARMVEITISRPSSAGAIHCTA